MILYLPPLGQVWTDQALMGGGERVNVSRV